MPVCCKACYVMLHLYYIIFILCYCVTELYEFNLIGGWHMKGKMNTGMGEIVIDKDVIAKYAGTDKVDL